jgi:hypothetical protein
VFDKTTYERVSNKPFLHNARIEAKDRMVMGNLRKVIRLLKSLRYDANEKAGYEKVKISSYDIAALGHCMSLTLLTSGPDQDLKLAQQACVHLTELENNSALRAIVKVANEMRLIFCAEGATVEGLKALNSELKMLLYEAENDMARSFRKLAEARIRY